MITTLYNVVVPIQSALRAHDYVAAEKARRRALSFIDDVFSGFWKRLSLKRMYLLTAKYDASIDMVKVDHDVAKIERQYKIDNIISRLHKDEYKHYRKSSSIDIDCTETTNNDYHVTFYDTSTYV